MSNLLFSGTRRSGVQPQNTVGLLGVTPDHLIEKVISQRHLTSLVGNLSYMITLGTSRDARASFVLRTRIGSFEARASRIVELHGPRIGRRDKC